MDEFLAVAPGYIVFLSAAVPILLALFMLRAGPDLQRRFEPVLLVAVFAAVWVMAQERTSMAMALLFAAATFIFRWFYQCRSPWLVSGLLSSIALCAAFLPWWPDLGSHVVLYAAEVPVLSAHVRPVLFVVAINLIALSPLLQPRGHDHSSSLSRPLVWASGFVLLAIALGLWLGGIHFSPTRWEVVTGLASVTAIPILVGLMGHAFMVAAIEESFFRGVLIPMLGRAIPASRVKIRMPASVGVSSLLFGLAHLHLGWPWVLGGFVAGIGYGILYVSHRSLIPPILVHAIVVLILTTFFTV